MPKISEATVAEHRARQLRTLLDAARALVAEEGIEALSLAALARRVGLSRPSLYEYFRSKDDLVAAVLEQELPRWAEHVERALAGVQSLDGKVEAYIRAQLEVMTDGRHAAAVALVEHALAEPALERIRVGHAQLLRPLAAALDAGGVPEPALRAELIQGLVDAAARVAQRDPAAAGTVVAATLAQATGGLGQAGSCA
ncbi:TetR/AcrR family transcriptional regulator [Actinomadura madurae]|uniref:TetR/AcrR family transcriptional regulator n=1 Tax=Actinomadura madurae TaxID=1993 RepID=UPI002025C69A|nr:TetR/AcrR family transcriptional regulator [Actinomadura madurae]URM94498.1 TetR/AcrR family transcriptional regulator [Actinomadura madurae]URN05209.1 TetR/AcrR family transcriptional regulator [Actinomadura madurae]